MFWILFVIFIYFVCLNVLNHSAVLTATNIIEKYILVAVKTALFFFVSFYLVCLSTFTTNTTSKLHVFGHDGDTFRVNGAQIGVLEQTNQVRLTGLLQCRNGRRLEAQVGLEVLCNLTNETLKRQLANQQFR
jgi:hypothetical protein